MLWQVMAESPMHARVDVFGVWFCGREKKSSEIEVTWNTAGWIPDHNVGCGIFSASFPRFELKKRKIGLVRENFVVKVYGDRDWQVY